MWFTLQHTEEGVAIAEHGLTYIWRHTHKEATVTWWGLVRAKRGDKSGESSCQKRKRTSDQKKAHGAQQRAMQPETQEENHGAYSTLIDHPHPRRRPLAKTWHNYISTSAVALALSTFAHCVSVPGLSTMSFSSWITPTDGQFNPQGV